MVDLFIANTDNNWFDFLADEPNLQEANFWQPSAKAFHAIQPGELLAFRLKSPRNKVGGYGVLSNSSVLPLQIAWEAFGRANGAASQQALNTAIGQFRREIVGPATNIGCRILVEPVFFPEHLWFDLPSSWSNTIMGGKRFSTDEAVGMRLWEKLQETGRLALAGAPPGIIYLGERFGKPTLITPRLGQGAFRIAVTEMYGRQCALTEGRVLPVTSSPMAKVGLTQSRTAFCFGATSIPSSIPATPPSTQITASWSATK